MHARDIFQSHPANPCQQCRELFDSLDKVESILSKTRYVAGNQLTEADVRLFMTLIRFDEVGQGGWLVLNEALSGCITSPMLRQSCCKEVGPDATGLASLVENSTMLPWVLCAQVYVVYFKTSEHPCCACCSAAQLLDAWAVLSGNFDCMREMAAS